MQTAFLIDGFNFYHSIKPLDKKLRWFDYREYCRHFMNSKDSLHSITYFTALADWRPEAAERHKVFIAANRARGIDVVLGEFKEKEITCPHCKQIFTRHEEKATDVNIALYAYRLAVKLASTAERIILISGDTDLIPAINMIKEDCPKIEVGVIFPYNRSNKELKQAAHFFHKTKKKILIEFQLPDEIIKENYKKIIRPAAWQ
jgi:uncharacterized LabA/DUF88 family protein